MIWEGFWGDFCIIGESFEARIMSILEYALCLEEKKVKACFFRFLDLQISLCLKIDDKSWKDWLNRFPLMIDKSIVFSLSIWGLDTTLKSPKTITDPWRDVKFVKFFSLSEQLSRAYSPSTDIFFVFNWI